MKGPRGDGQRDAHEKHRHGAQVHGRLETFDETFEVDTAAQDPRIADLECDDREIEAQYREARAHGVYSHALG
jgi:hypothetical protein